MSPFQALVLGLIQGFTELLPISSSAHLSLTPVLLNWEPAGLAFDVALHFGTLVAILWYFRREWRNLLSASWSVIRKRRAETVEERRAVFIVVATIPAGIGGLLLEEKAETVFRNPVLTATMLIIMGILLWAGDRFSRADRDLTKIRWLDALLIGCAQVLALIPGVSRSGSTITTARVLRIDRQSAAVFSFLMSMPITAAAIALKGPEAVQQGGLWTEVLIGIIAAAISSWIAIAVLLRYVSRHSYGIFAVYRIVVAIAVLVFLQYRG